MLKLKEYTLKRDRLEIYYCILRSYIVNEKHTRSSLNRQLLIPYSLLNECLMHLQALDFINIDYNEKTIKTTLKGQNYVRKFGYIMQQVGYISKMST